jgi:hypothetical protein
MSNLDDVMQERMAYIVFHERRPFSYSDFSDLMKHQTFRNMICRLKKDGIVELNHNSGIAFYTLKGQPFGKSSTPIHTGGLTVNVSNNDPLYQRIKNLPMGKQSIHDIRITFPVPNIYEAFAINTTFHEEKYSGDIRPFKLWNLDNSSVQVTIHKSNTVSVILACSQEPFPLDYSGIIAFFSTLADIHGLLVGIMLSIYSQKINEIENRIIPRLSDWIITMWHFGRDSLIEYSGKDVHDSVDWAHHVLERVYPKIIKGKRILRYEVQEYPNKPVFEAIEDKLNMNVNNVTQNDNAVSVEEFQ